jgi:GNAT superfamily N-acetyltransferase
VIRAGGGESDSATFADEVAERIECSAMESWYGAGASVGAPTATARDGAVLAFCLEGCLDAMMNRVVGLGTALPATPEGVGAALDWFRARRAERFLVHVTPNAQPAELRRWLTGSGLRPFRGWMKFGRGREPVVRPRSSLAVRRAGPELERDFARIACSAFGLPSEAAALTGALCSRNGWHCFVSFSGDTPAGIGALYVADEAGWLGFGATLPEFRGRGGQAAVLAARLEAAFDAGCRTVITETGEAVPGDPQHSYKNILKAGFRELYLRENFAGGLPKP